MKLLRMEFFKCRRRKIALICLAFVAVQLAWMGRTLTQMEPRELAQGWMSLLYNLAVIDAVMLPLTISALASRNCEMEHKGSTWKLWETVTTPQLQGGLAADRHSGTTDAHNGDGSSFYITAGISGRLGKSITIGIKPL